MELMAVQIDNIYGVTVEERATKRQQKIVFS
jgi:hypothetical protein